MTLEDQIQALLAKAEPLRALPDDEPAKDPLGGLVEEINALRALQDAATRGLADIDSMRNDIEATVEGADAEPENRAYDPNETIRGYVDASGVHLDQSPPAKRPKLTLPKKADA